MEQLTLGGLDNWDYTKISESAHSSTTTTALITDILADQELLDTRNAEGVWITWGVALHDIDTEYVVTCVSQESSDRRLREIVCLHVMAALRSVLLEETSRAQDSLDNSFNASFLESLNDCMRDLRSIAHHPTEVSIEAALAKFVELDDISALIWWEIDEAAGQ